MNNEKETKVSRREFLGLAWAFTLLAMFAQTGTALFKFIKPRILSGAFGGKIPAGQLAEFKIGTVSHVQRGRYFISHLENDGLLALWHRCTHLGCTIPWKQDEGVFHCPCHSSIFNEKGEVISGPAPRPMDLFPIEIIDGQVIVDTSKPIVRNKYDPSQGTRV